MPASSPADSSINVYFPPMFFSIADIHPEQHLCPILGVGAAGAGVNAQDGIVVIDMAR